ncbi:hypothetical protein ABIB30_005555 [Pedobacter sp. UYP1]
MTSFQFIPHTSNNSIFIKLKSVSKEKIKRSMPEMKVMPFKIDQNTLIKT